MLLLLLLLLLDSTRLDIRIKSQKHDRNGGGAPSEDPRELRRSPTLKRECAKRGIVHTKNDEKMKTMEQQLPLLL